MLRPCIDMAIFHTVVLGLLEQHLGIPKKNEKFFIVDSRVSIVHNVIIFSIVV